MFLCSKCGAEEFLIPRVEDDTALSIDVVGMLNDAVKKTKK